MFIAFDRKLVGLIGIADTLKETTKSAIQKFKAMGLKVVMITGDNVRTAQAIAQPNRHRCGTVRRSSRKKKQVK